MIIGVNKCGTITLGKLRSHSMEANYKKVNFSETFLSYHPNIISAGEQRFFEGSNQIQTREVYVERMPPIRFRFL